MSESHVNAFHFCLQDGMRVLLRPVLPEDRDRVRIGITQMSPASRYLRFFTGGPQLSEEQIRRLTDVDQINHVAWGALDPSVAGIPGLGLGRYVRLEKEPGIAEFAVAVIDPVQCKGLGRILLGILYLVAQSRQIRILRGLVLPENVSVSEWLRRLGASIRHGAGVDIAELPVRQDLTLFLENPSAQRFRGVLEDLQRAMSRRS